MNLHARAVELRSTPETQRGALQKSTDFVKAFMLGFAVADAIALLRLDDLYLDSFDVTDVKPLSGDHLARAIGRVAGKGGKTKYTIENVTKTRIVLADSRIHILGAFQNIRMVRAAPLRAAGAGRSCGRRRRGTPSPTSSSEAPRQGLRQAAHGGDAHGGSVLGWAWESEGCPLRLLGAEGRPKGGDWVHSQSP